MSEFYAPWRISGPNKHGLYTVWDDSGNPMATCEDDDYFMSEAVRRINVHDDLLAACEAAEAEMDACGATSTETLERLRAAIANARGEHV